MKDDKVKIIIAEMFGTMVLVIGGCGTAILATGSFGEGNTVGILGVAIAFGLSLLCMVYAIGPISGCHINPAVTLGMAVAKKIKTSMVPYYWVAQLTGGVIGALVIKLIASGNKSWNIKEVSFATNGFGKLDTATQVGSPGGFSLSAVGISEIILTALFVLVCIHTTRKDFAIGFGGIAAGLMLTLVHIISIPVSNTSVNPARSFSVALFKGGESLNPLWAFIVFPLIGAIIAGLLAAYVFVEDKTTTQTSKASA